MSIKNTIIGALKQDNDQLRNKAKLQGKKVTEVEISHKNLGQYARRNNIEIQGIPSQISDENQEQKVIEVFGAINIAITKSDVKNCYRLQNFRKNYCSVCKQKAFLCNFKQEI